MEKIPYKRLIKSALYSVLALLTGVLFLNTNLVGFFIAQISFVILAFAILMEKP